MSLRIWLPLNGTLDNQGLDQITVTNNGATIDNNGKIGKCYSFDGNTSGININGDIISTLAQGDFSISFWVYNDDQGNRSIYIATIPSSSYAFAIQKTTGEGLRVYWQSSPDYYPTNFTVPVQEWCHITVVIKNNNCYCYRNGILITSREDGSFTPQKLTNTWLYGMLGRDLRRGATVLKGKLNDFRWYDHALSPLEVKQISQGLILHYPLNRNGWGQDNILPQTNELTAWVKESNVTCVKENDWFVITDVKARSARWGIYKNDVIIKPNTDYAFSVECEGSTSIQLCTNSSLTNKIQIIYNQQGKKSGTFNTGELFGTDDICYMRVYIWPTYANNHESKVRYFKIEEGTKITPWCPNSSDELYNTLGLNNNIQYDTSGYGNNGTRTGTFSWTSDTPKYEVSTYMPTTAIITHNRCLDNTNQEWSCAAWVKPKVAGNFQNLNNFNKANRLYHGTYPLLYINAGTNDYFNYGNLALPANQWSHIVFVFKNSTGTKLIYINGENHTNMNGPNKTSTPKGIPDSVIIGNGNYEGGLCDYREYATALSAEDIKSLYNNSAYIDNQGNIYGAVYEEV